ncbi:cytochrome P450 [Aspergillus uvarum CBS 121591]|uniref:Cytochrome P450 n=1 Tax=Aspergillus uvarum CBS 121591 TaxID=1448315 RepID=A0A319C0B2_9EURO|nr:cytochrome P450 [Aspergillus uvarum CBS 121591]PYH78485.1 cytochrome P450 [Aspergillus uvarum CBS 121591]
MSFLGDLYIYLYLAALKTFPVLPTTLIVCFFFHRFVIAPLYNELARLPTVRYRWFLPDVLNRLAFYFYGCDQIAQGYRKYKDRAFRLLTTDGDLVVLPLQYLWEIEQLPITTLSAARARHKNLLSEYTDVVRGSTNVSRAVAEMSQQNLQHITMQFNDEFHKALYVEVPRCQYKWTPVNLYKLVLKLISRTTARFTVGEELYLNELWLETVPSYTSDILTTIILLRPVPQVLRPLVARFLPSLRRARARARWAQTELLMPTIQSRQHKEVHDGAYQKPQDLMQRMLDTATTNFDREPANIAKALMSTITLSIVHPITNLVTHAVYDALTQGQGQGQGQTIGPLRIETEEILSLIEHDDEFGLITRPYQGLMDSFLREVLRWNPLSELNPRYTLLKTHTFTTFTTTTTTKTQQSLPLTLPAATQITFPAGPLSRDATIIPHAERFDAFRWTRDPLEVLPLLRPDTIDPRLRKAVAFDTGLADTSPVNLHFGWGGGGRGAVCPGRHLAARLAAVVLGRLLVQYDLRLFPGEKRRRPGNLGAGELVFPNPGVRVLVRERERGG